MSTKAGLCRVRDYAEFGSGRTGNWFLTEWLRRSPLSVTAHNSDDEDPTTTHLYVEADLAMREAALKRVNDLGPRHVRFKAPGRLLAFLETL